MHRKSEIILGIDPGTIVMGYGIVKIEKNKPELLEMGVLKLSKYKDANQRLQIIYNKITELHKAFLPSNLPLKRLFLAKTYKVCSNWAGPKG